MNTNKSIDQPQCRPGLIADYLRNHDLDPSEINHFLECKSKEGIAPKINKLNDRIVPKNYEIAVESPQPRYVKNISKIVSKNIHKNSDKLVPDTPQKISSHTDPNAKSCQESINERRKKFAALVSKSKPQKTNPTLDNISWESLYDLLPPELVRCNETLEDLKEDYNVYVNGLKTMGINTAKPKKYHRKNTSWETISGASYCSVDTRLVEQIPDQTIDIGLDTASMDTNPCFSEKNNLRNKEVYKTCQYLSDCYHFVTINFKYLSIQRFGRYLDKIWPALLEYFFLGVMFLLYTLYFIVPLVIDHGSISITFIWTMQLFLLCFGCMQLLGTSLRILTWSSNLVDGTFVYKKVTRDWDNLIYETAGIEKNNSKEKVYGLLFKQGIVSHFLLTSTILLIMVIYSLWAVSIWQMSLVQYLTIALEGCFLGYYLGRLTMSFIVRMIKLAGIICCCSHGMDSSFVYNY